MCIRDRVDAAIKALKKIIDRHMVLKEFTIQAISKGSDDMGKVHMQVEYDGQMYYGCLLYTSCGCMWNLPYNNYIRPKNNYANLI